MYPLDFTFELHTDRLVLRLPRVEDLDAWAVFCLDTESMRFLGGPQSRFDTWREMMSITGAWALLGLSMFSVVERDTGAWVGRVGPWYPEGWPGTEIAYGIAPGLTGRGFATEAAAAACDYAVDRIGWTHIVHLIDPANSASVAVARRLGVRNEGPVRLPAPDDQVRVEAWGQSAEAWTNRQRSLGAATSMSMSKANARGTISAPTVAKQSRDLRQPLSAGH